MTQETTIWIGGVLITVILGLIVYIWQTYRASTNVDNQTITAALNKINDSQLKVNNSLIKIESTVETLSHDINYLKKVFYNQDILLRDTREDVATLKEWRRNLEKISVDHD